MVKIINLRHLTYNLERQVCVYAIFPLESMESMFLLGKLIRKGLVNSLSSSGLLESTLTGQRVKTNDGNQDTFTAKPARVYTNRLT